MVFSYVYLFSPTVCLLQAFRKFDEMSGKLTEQLRKLAKQVFHLLPPLRFCTFVGPLFCFFPLCMFIFLYFIFRCYTLDTCDPVIVCTL